MTVLVVGPNTKAFTLASSSLGGTDQLGGYPTVTVSVTISVTQTQTATLTASASHPLTISVTQTETPTIAAPASHPKALSATETQTPTVAEVAAHARTLSATEAETPTVSAVVAYLRQISATVTQTSTIDHTFISGSGSTTLQDVTGTITQSATIVATPIIVPNTGGEVEYRPRKQRRAVPPKQTARFLRVAVTQTADLEPLYVAGERTLRMRADDEAIRLLTGVALSRDDDEVLLLLT